jgi:hypothetical protein
MKRVAFMMCHRAIEAAKFWEQAQIGAAPTVHLKRARDQV